MVFYNDLSCDKISKHWYNCANELRPNQWILFQTKSVNWFDLDIINISILLLASYSSYLMFDLIFKKNWYNSTKIFLLKIETDFNLGNLKFEINSK